MTCQAGPTNHAAYQTGSAASGPCSIDLHPTAGATVASTITSPSICGYNQDAMFYCPWQMGDAIPAAAMAAFQPVMSYAAANCSPASAGLGSCSKLTG